MLIQYLNKDTYKDNNTFRTSEWRQEEADALCREARFLNVPGLRNGKPMTLGDYIDKTPREFTSKVTLEEIVFDTWYSGRTVLIGDGEFNIVTSLRLSLGMDPRMIFLFSFLLFHIVPLLSMP